ncbi:MAG TPA: Glu-tRNA(Gln) amidotransferase subunit GatD [Candidatus Nanoarchaeia archaeon]|nr:Glu-tRNA(Gln) amidotransferase subunit GatD [Candidatus Nanoarchaeia archaeon]
MAQAGDRIAVDCGDETLEGILVPAENTAALVLKLDSGYNIGIDRKRVKHITVLQAAAQGKAKRKLLPPAKGKPTIAILHTGGTIASKVDYASGGVIAGFLPEDFLEMFPAVGKLANIVTAQVANIMSEDMRFSYHQQIAQAIQEQMKSGVDGIIVGHGTDTLAVSAAALAFMFESLSIPVLLVGAQRSTDRPSTDAAVNLLCAAQFILKSDFTGVAICMHSSPSDDACSILPPCKTRKVHTTRRDAFKAVNGKPIATVTAEGKVTFHTDYQKQGKAITVLPKMEEKIAVVRSYVNMGPEFIDALTAKKFKGLILEATGLGQAPMNIPENLANYEALKKFIAQGGIVGLTSQCIWGRVHPDVYTNCRRLSDIGVIFCEDMLTDTAYVKLAWLLANKPQQAKELLAKNLRGEISERTEYDSVAPEE